MWRTEYNWSYFYLLNKNRFQNFALRYTIFFFVLYELLRSAKVSHTND